MQVGGVYSVARAKGSFGVVKVVAQDEQNTIYARIFGSHFRVRPEAEWFENREPGKLVEELRIGIGVLPVTQRVFDFWQPMLLLSQAITEEEQENLGECLGVAQAWDDLIYP